MQTDDEENQTKTQQRSATSDANWTDMFTKAIVQVMIKEARQLIKLQPFLLKSIMNFDDFCVFGSYDNWHSFWTAFATLNTDRTGWKYSVNHCHLSCNISKMAFKHLVLDIHRHRQNVLQKKRTIPSEKNRL